MLNKIYLAILSVSIGLMAFFTYYSWSWLQSIGLPAAAVEGYTYTTKMAWTVLWLSTVALLVLGNAVLWVSRRAWAMWMTLLYFSVFIAIRYFWLHQAFFQFQTDNGLWDGGLLIAPLSASILIVVIGAVVFFDQFVVVRLHRKMYPPIVAEEPRTPVDSESTVE